MDADAIVIGGGVIGLSIALELGRRGVTCIAIDSARDGAASNAAAGLLAPSIGHLSDDVRPFFFESLERYPAFVDSLRAFEPSLRLLSGLVEVSTDGQRHTHPRDGAIDNVLLVNALRGAVRSVPAVRSINAFVQRVEATGRAVSVTTDAGARVSAPRAVLAAGAWSPRIEGLPRPIPVFPLKGQMLAVTSTALSQAMLDDNVYLVPRPTEVVIGATAEHAGFDVTVEPAAIERLRQAAVVLAPELRNAPAARAWAGIRPATRDMLPILGPEPKAPALLYACGHSKNGILLAPMTAVAIADAVELQNMARLTPFSIERFE